MSTPYGYASEQPSLTYTGPLQPTVVTVTIASALSLHNALELLLLIFSTFKQRRGLYFWSLLIASGGVIPYTVGFLLQYFELAAYWGTEIITTVGWVTMVTGQSFVLYSRLGLIVHDRRILAAVKYMIITNGVILHTATTVLNYGGHYKGGNFTKAYKIEEKFQMTAFCIQEFIISGIYVVNVAKLLKVVEKSKTRRVMWQLFTINIIIIILDTGLLAVEYKDYRVLEQTIKGYVYSVKLKLEFVILRRLVELVESSKRNLSQTLEDVSAFVDESRASPVVTRIGTEDSKPSWLVDLERRNAVGGLHRTATHTSQNVVVDEEKNAIGPVSPRSIPVVYSPSSWRNRRSTTDSDLMYAEMLRDISEGH